MILPLRMGLLSEQPVEKEFWWHQNSQSFTVSKKGFIKVLWAIILDKWHVFIWMVERLYTNYTLKIKVRIWRQQDVDLDLDCTAKGKKSKKE